MDSEFVDDFIKHTFPYFNQSVKKLTHPPEGFERSIERSVRQTAKSAFHWSSRFQVYGMTKPKPTSDAISLRYGPPRQFHKVGKNEDYDELYLVDSIDNILLLGDPGSGKTTTLRRAVYRIVTCPREREFIPIVVELRTLTPGQSILYEIAASLGVKAEKGGGLKDSFMRPSYGDKEEIIFIDDDRGLEQKKLSSDNYYVGEELLEDVIFRLLSELKVLIILDGLDEVTFEPRVLKSEIQRLGENSGKSKVIVSCRSGDYRGGLSGYFMLQICALTNDDIREISENYIEDVEGFITQLDSSPYRDIADRPLFLTHLILIYQRYRVLPEQPVDIYEMIVILSLKEWDADKSISRISQYSRFSPERKLKFLSLLSYHLTYVIKTKVFSRRKLKTAYLAINKKFNLPSEQMDNVIDELESHTGIIVKASYNTYEFSHLSLQEYLAADYMSRESFSVHLYDYLSDYPAPVAISIALASDPGLAFASVIFNNECYTADSIKSFLSRISQERPNFDDDASLGVAILWLFGVYGEREGIRESLNKMLDLPNVLSSLREAIQLFIIQRFKGRRKLVRVGVVKGLVNIDCPKEFEINKEVLDALIEITGCYSLPIMAQKFD